MAIRPVQSHTKWQQRFTHNRNSSHVATNKASAASAHERGNGCEHIVSTEKAGEEHDRDAHRALASDKNLTRDRLAIPMWGVGEGHTAHSAN
eukprot:4673000-Pleurochrysis_carterae.AAC.2